MRAPSVFSIIEATSDTLKFMSRLHNSIRKKYHVNIDMSAIEYMSEDAILYMLSRLDYFNKKYPNQRISGNFPDDEKCKEILVRSGFPDYVVTDSKYKRKYFGDVYPITKGFEIEGKIADDIINFTKRKLRISDATSSQIYGVIIESITNSNNHAYRPQDLPENCWWTIAIPDKKHRKVHFTTLDNGDGIPSTIRREFWEQLQALSGFKKGSKEWDVKLIISALQGAFRTSTGKEERGTGLPTIFGATQLKGIANLTIISNFAYIVCDNDLKIRSTKILDSKFHGTLISWDFIEESNI